MTFSGRIRGVLTLDAATFEEIEANRSINVQAFALVVASSLAAGIGVGGFSDVAILAETLTALFLWVTWAAVTYFIGTRLLPEPQTSTNMGELLRVFGFSSAPSLFAVFAVIPIIGWLVWPIVGLWVFAATVIAVRQALDYRSTARAFAVVIIGWVMVLFINWLLFR